MTLWAERGIPSPPDSSSSRLHRDFSRMTNCVGFVRCYEIHQSVECVRYICPLKVAWYICPFKMAKVWNCGFSMTLQRQYFTAVADCRARIRSCVSAPVLNFAEYKGLEALRRLAYPSAHPSWTEGMRTTRLMSSLIPYTTAGRYEFMIKQRKGRGQ